MQRSPRHAPTPNRCHPILREYLASRRGARWSPENIYGAQRILERLQVHLKLDDVDLIEAKRCPPAGVPQRRPRRRPVTEHGACHHRQLKAFYVWARARGLHRRQPDDRHPAAQGGGPRPGPDAGAHRGRLPGDARHLLPQGQADRPGHEDDQRRPRRGDDGAAVVDRDAPRRAGRARVPRHRLGRDDARTSARPRAAARPTAGSCRSTRKRCTT